MATNEYTKELQSLKHHANDIGMTKAKYQATIYNENKACVQWSASVISKVIKHLNLREKMVLRMSSIKGC